MRESLALDGALQTMNHFLSITCQTLTLSYISYTAPELPIAVCSKILIRIFEGFVATQVSGSLLDAERAPSNIIWILFDYIFFRIKIILFKMWGGVRGTCPPCSRVLTPLKAGLFQRSPKINKLQN